MHPCCALATTGLCPPCYPYGMSHVQPRPLVLAVCLAFLAVVGGVALQTWLSPANILWLAAFGLACGSGLLALRNARQTSTTIAQVLYETEHAGRPDKG